MWAAGTPTEVKHFGPSNRLVWQCTIIHNTEEHPCHMTRIRGYWAQGEHRNAATALACAEKLARQMNRDQ